MMSHFVLTLSQIVNKVRISSLPLDSCHKLIELIKLRATVTLRTQPQLIQTGMQCSMYESRNYKEANTVLVFFHILND